MFSKLWHKMTGHRRENPEQSYRAASAATGIPKSTLHAHDQRLSAREVHDESSFWNSEAGQSFLKRMVVGVIYTFGIKGGMGAGRIEEFMKIIQVGTHVAISRTSIYRTTIEIEAVILRYQELQKQGLKEQAAAQKEYIEVVLGADETWLDRMLLVCQELSSGYLFLNSQARKEALKSGIRPLKNNSTTTD